MMIPAMLGPGPPALSAAVQRLLEALDCVHMELSMPQPPEAMAALQEVAEQLRGQICTLVGLLRPRALPPDFTGGLGTMMGGRGRPQ